MINEKLERLLEATSGIRPGIGRKLKHIKVQTPENDSPELKKKLEELGVRLVDKPKKRKLKKQLKLKKKAEIKDLKKQLKVMKKTKIKR